MQHVRKSIESTSINTLLWRYSLPAMLGMLLHAINPIIDRYFIGQEVPEIGLVAQSVAFPIFSLLMALSLWMGVGSATLLSLKIGQDDQDEVKRLLKTAGFISLMVLPALAGLLYLSLDSLISWSGGKGDVVAATKAYLTPLFIGFIAWSYSTFISGAIRCFGFPKLSLLVAVTSPLLNIGLDYIFVVQCQWGLAGAGWATILGYLGSAIIGALLWKRFSPFNKNEPFPSILKFSTTTGGIAKFGLATLLLQLSGAIFQSLINQQAERYGGDQALAILGLIMILAGFIFMPITGLGQGIQPILGVSQGSGHYQKSREIFWLASLYGTLILILCYTLVMIDPAWIIKWFYPDSTTPAMANHAAHITFILMPVIAFQIIAINFFQAVGSPNISTALVIIRQIIVLPILLFTLPRLYQLNGVWLVSPVSDGLMALVTATVLLFFFRKLSLQNTPMIKE